MLDSIYHMTLKSFHNHVFGVKDFVKFVCNIIMDVIT